MTHHQFRRTLLSILGLPESTPDPEGAILATVRRRLKVDDALTNPGAWADYLGARLEDEQEAREKAERERDALMSLIVVPGTGLYAGCWLVIAPAIDPTVPRIYPTQEAAIAAVCKAAGITD